MPEKQKILIVDDKKENLIALRHVLSGMDVELVEAISGNQALAATFDHQFAVAILDVQMPGMSGYELAEHLRGDEKTVKIPILFLTAHSGDEQDIFKGYEAGGIDYLTKPYSPEVLRGKLKIFLEIDRYRRGLEILVADQKLLAQRLSDHQFYTRSLFESNIDAIMTTDPSGIVTDVNKQMEVLTGYTSDELIGAPFKNYFTDPARAEMSIKLVMRDKKLTDYELTVRAKDGRETEVSYNATTFYDQDRRLQGMFAAARDITERKRVDQVLQQYNVELERARGVAEKANLAKSEFLSSMSHELRSPLNAILGFAQLMESDSPPPTQSQTESIEQILRAGWHLLKLIDEILDLAKVESRQVPLSLEPVSLAEILHECQIMLEQQALKRDIQMIYPRFDKSVFVVADRTRLKQVLINLLTNAIKYNSKQGKVAVTFSDSSTGHVRVSISDTGAGLRQEELAQLFHAFNRLGQEGGGEEGTGIGLVVAKQLVELMGGVIGVHSTVGEGSVFWFELIAVAEPHMFIEGGDAAPSAPLRMPDNGRAYTLLYVEDNPANLKLVEQIIARHPDFTLLTAVNGYKGVELARATIPDVILMDINLPDINGYEALSLLRSDQATALIPVIAISANAMPLDIERGLKAGFFSYKTKPIRVNELMDALAVALEHAKSSGGPS